MNFIELGRKLRRLSQVEWYHTQPRLFRSSVAAHSFETAVLAYFLGRRNGRSDRELLEIVMSALLHDLEEGFTGDVNALVKLFASDRWKEEWASIKDTVAKGVILGKEEREVYQLWKKSGQYPEVKVADILSMFLAALEEVEAGNRHFRHTLYITKEWLEERDLDLAKQAHIHLERLRVGRWDVPQGVLQAMAKRGVILDYDGVISDTRAALVELAIDTISQHFSLSREEVQGLWAETGLSFADQLGMLFPGDPRVREAVKDYEGRRLRLDCNYNYFPDSLEFIRGLQGRGMRVGVCSSSPRKVIEKAAEDLGLVYPKGRSKGEQLRNFADGIHRIVFISDSPDDFNLLRGLPNVRFLGLARRGEDAERFELEGLPYVEDLGPKALVETLNRLEEGS